MSEENKNPAEEDRADIVRDIEHLFNQPGLGSVEYRLYREHVGTLYNGLALLASALVEKSVEQIKQNQVQQELKAILYKAHGLWVGNEVKEDSNARQTDKTGESEAV